MFDRQGEGLICGGVSQGRERGEKKGFAKGDGRQCYKGPEGLKKKRAV